MTYIKSYRNQNYLIPPNLADLIPENHICYMIEQITDEVDYSYFDQKYEGAGHPAYHPRIILKLLIQGYVDGIRSARKLAKASSENIIYIYLSEKTNPDFRTISDFRKDNQDLIKQVIVQVNQIALQYNLLDLSQIMIDGTSIKANANDELIISKDSIEKLLKYVDKELQRDIELDADEDRKFGKEELNKLPEEIDDNEKRRRMVQKIGREINRAVFKKDKDALEKTKVKLVQFDEQVKERDFKKLSLTDADARFSQNKKKVFELGYNVQLATDANGFLLSSFVSKSSVDRGQLCNNVKQIQHCFDLKKGTIITADAGYEKTEEFVELTNQGFELYVPTRGANKDKRDEFSPANFDYNKDTNEFICPEGKILKQYGVPTNEEMPRVYFASKIRDCKFCKNKTQCCKNLNRKKFHLSVHYPLLLKLRDRINDPVERLIYSKRKETVERSIGDIKHNKNFRMFALRGITKVQIEVDLMRIAHNLVMINNRVGKLLGSSIEI